MSYFEEDDRSDWGKSKTSREDLDHFWEKLTKVADTYVQEEMCFFIHCTSKSGKKGILDSNTIRGEHTKFPSEAPLESNSSLNGTWFSLSTRKLPKRSPYGTQRCTIKFKYLLEYLGKHDDHSDDVVVEGCDSWDAPSNETPTKSGKGGKGAKGAKGGKKKPERKVNKRQKGCYLKGKVDPPQEPTLFLMPLLFFECAHCFGNIQYIRLLLVRAFDPKVDWCQTFCKEIDIQDNPFLQVTNDRLYTHRRKETGDQGGYGSVFIEVLVVGDIQLDQLPAPPEWDEVGTMCQAGGDPRIGLC